MVDYFWRSCHLGSKFCFLILTSKACRSAERGAEAVARIQSLIKEEVEAPKIEAGKVDLASLHSIQEFATQFKSRGAVSSVECLPFRPSSSYSYQ